MKKQIMAKILAVIIVMTFVPSNVFATEPQGDAEFNYVYEDGVVYKQNGEETKTELTGDELAEFSGVSLHGIADFNGKVFPTMEAAVSAVSAKLAETGGLGQDGLTEEEFNALYTDKVPEDSEHQGVSLTWTIFGEVQLPSTLNQYYLSGGRQAAWYGSVDRSIRAINIVGYDDNASIDIEKPLKMPYLWWGETADDFMALSIKNLTLDCAKVNAAGSFAIEANYKSGFDTTLDNCNIQGSIHYYFHGKGNVTVNDCNFDGNGSTASYAFFAQGHETEPLAVQFTNNTVSGYPRGINIDQATAHAVISGNTITPGVGYSAVQISGCQTILIENNTIYDQGNAITLHVNLANNQIDNREITVKNNKIYSVDGVQGYLIYDDISATNKDGEYFTLVWEGNAVDSGIISDQGIKGSEVYDLSSYVSSVLSPVAKIGNVGYNSLQAALDDAQNGDTVQILPGTHSEAITMPLTNITVQGPEDHTAILTGGISFAGGSASGLNMTIEDLVFDGKGISLTAWTQTTDLDQVGALVFRDNEFRNITGDNIYAIHINNGDSPISGLTITQNQFSGAQDSTKNGGVYATVCGTATITNNIFANMGFNGITLSGSDGIKTVVISDNKFDQWATHGTGEKDGRAMRLSNLSDATTLDITKNSFICDTMQEEIIKVTELGAEQDIDLSYCYWNGLNPDEIIGEGQGKILLVRDDTTEEGTNENTQLGPYYTAPTMRPEDLNTYVPSSSGGGGGSSSYSVSVDKNIDNGSVTVSPKSTSSGRTVTITVKADEGYELDELTVTDKNGDEIELTDKGDGRYTFKMPRSKVTIEASFVEIDHQDTCPSAGFRDVDEDAWYHEAVDYALDNGLMSGVSGREFAPGSTLTRAMVAQMLYSLEGKPAAGSADFADVAEDAWYADAISWAAGEGIVSGYGDTFGPNDPITREQLAAILYRYAQNEGYKTSQSGKGTEGYLDASSISSYAVKAMDWAVNAGLLSGKGNNTLAPTAGATRAEVAQIFMNFCKDTAK